MSIHGSHLLLSRAATELAWLSPPPVFIGGCAVACQLDARALNALRVTMDVDLVLVGVTTYHDHAAVERTLRSHGWTNDQREGAPICRFLSPSGLTVDVMPVDPTTLGFTARWYTETVARAKLFTLQTGVSVRAGSPACLLACKLDAYAQRGAADPLSSFDLDDIGALLDGSAALEDDLADCSDALRAFVRSGLTTIRGDRRAMDALSMNMDSLVDGPVRLDAVLSRIDRIIG